MKKYILQILLALFLTSHVHSQKTNIVFILADDLGYGDVGFTGQKKIQTPHLDALAKEGFVLNNFYAGAPVCSPSRFTLLTGRNAGHATIRGNATIQGGTVGYKGSSVVKRANILPSDSTIGNILQSSWYTTALMGKWHIGGYDSLATPLQHGFSLFKGWLINKPETYVSTYWPDHWMHNDTMISIPENSLGKQQYYSADIITDDAVSFIESVKEQQKPFFVMVNYSNPHSPLDAPIVKEYADSAWSHDAKTYASMVTLLDNGVNRIVSYLQKNGLDKNTIVFFTSDNGPRSEPTAQLTTVANFFHSSGPLKGFKRDLNEGGIREPFFAWSHIEGFPNKDSSDVPLYFPDILPTLGGLAANKDLNKYQTEGKDFSFLLQKNGKDSKKHFSDRFLYWEFFEGGFKQAVRMGKWKAIVQDNEIELYDLSQDIGETKNVAKANPKIIYKIQSYLKNCRTASPYWPANIDENLK